MNAPIGVLQGLTGFLSVPDQQHWRHGWHWVHGQDVGRLQGLLPKRRQQAQVILGWMLGKEKPAWKPACSGGMKLGTKIRNLSGWITLCRRSTFDFERFIDRIQIQLINDFLGQICVTSFKMVPSQRKKWSFIEFFYSC